VRAVAISSALSLASTREDDPSATRGVASSVVSARARISSNSVAGRGEELRVEGLSHRFGQTTVLDDVSFTVPPSQILALLGPSGCGKTTILRAIAGLVRPHGGRIDLGAQRIDQMPSRRRRIGMVFQSYALFPHLTVLENVGYGLAALGVARKERRARAQEMLALVRLQDFGNRLPRELSGGQQQRAAVARALAIAPRVLLLDEPFAALDKDLRLDLQIELVRLQKRLAITTIMVTHDQEEALSVANQVIVMRAGQIEQSGPPTEVYDRPKNLFVNLFVGRASVLKATVAEPGPARARLALSTGDTIELPHPVHLVRGAAAAVSVRPEHVSFGNGPNSLAATVVVSLPLGPTVVHELVLDDGTPLKLVEQRRTDSLGSPGQRVRVRLDPARVHVFPASDSPAEPSTN
jgi:putative spermidine/putrescine transport system ATP-binding protein